MNIMKTLLTILFVVFGLFAICDNDKIPKNNNVTIEQSFENITISFNHLDVVSITVIDSKNKVILKETDCHDSITTEFNDTGTYFIRIETKNEVIIQRLIISK